MTAFILLIPLLYTIPIACCWKLFRLAGKKPWLTVIPYYNIYVLADITNNKKWWWFLLIIFPYINTFMMMMLFIDLAKSHGRLGVADYLGAALIPIIYFPLISGISGKLHLEYKDPKTHPYPKKTVVRDWLDSILWAVMAALIIRTFIFESFTIPSSSMEKSLRTGDFLVVSKIGYGPRFPNTLLSFPFVHHTLPWTESTRSYLKRPSVGYHRLPGFGEIHRNDPIVFNFPAGDTVSTKYQSNYTYYQLIRQYGRENVLNNKAAFGDIITRPVDKRENYVKRLIGMPGDTILIKDGIVFVNGEQGFQPELMQHNYIIKTNGTALSHNLLKKYDISEIYSTGIPGTVVANINRNTAEQLVKLPFITSVTRVIAPKEEYSDEIFPNDTTHFKWNVDNFGPIVIPQEGVTVKLTKENIALYSRVITAYEHHKLRIEGDKIFIDDKQCDTYTFAMDYFWMMGDNRHNSQDSRFWGYVPIDHIVGKPVFVWLSIDKTFGGIRFDKTFRIPK